MKQLNYENDTYWQALEDFKIDKLMEKINAHSNLKQQEVENLAMILISQLIENINDDLITHYLNVIHNGNQDIIGDSINFKIPSLELPDKFLNTTNIPCFSYGAQVRWRVSESDTQTDQGIVIGRFYNFAPHLGKWAWCYLIYLSQDSPSIKWVSMDIAWEEDLELFLEEGEK